MKRYDRAKYRNAVGHSIASGGPGRRGDAAGQDTPFFRYKRDALMHLLKGLSWQDRRVVEVGCGPGGNLVLVTALGARHTVGIDVSQAMAREAFALADDLMPRVGVLVADGTHLPLQLRIADVGLTVTVLQHLDGEAAAQVVQEMCRVSYDELILCEDISVLGFGVRATHVLRRQRDYMTMAREAAFA